LKNNEDMISPTFTSRWIFSFAILQSITNI